MFKELPKKISPKVDIDKYNDEMRQAWSKLDAKIDELNEVIDERTNKIREIETELNNRKCYIPFTYSAFKSESVEAILSWARDERQKKVRFRLFIELKKHGATKVKKILIEARLETKLEVIKFLDPFVKNFTEFLIDQQKKLMGR
jgi:hypothetical protein